MSIWSSIGFASCLLACVCVYFASPHQRGLASPWPARRSRAAAALLWGLAWLALAQDMQRVTASFVLVTETMGALALLPFIGAWQSLRRGGAA